MARRTLQPVVAPLFTEGEATGGTYSAPVAMPAPPPFVLTLSPRCAELLARITERTGRDAEEQLYAILGTRVQAIEEARQEGQVA